jgi:hypothetical protein
MNENTQQSRDKRFVPRTKEEEDEEAEIMADCVRRHVLWCAAMHYEDCSCPGCVSRAEHGGKSVVFDRLIEEMLFHREERIAGGFVDRFTSQPSGERDNVR